jgi:uncharacterized phage protein (predicted DNA packaging)
MSIALSTVKEYLKIDSNSFDDELIRMIDTAHAMLTGAVDNLDILCALDDAIKKKADMIELMYTASLFEERTMTNAEQYSRVIETLIGQLQNASDKTDEELQDILSKKQEADNR